MNVRRKLPPILTLLLLLASSMLLRAQSYTSIVVFGDSLSDSGNFAHLSNSAYGLVIPGPVADYTSGRFTDGTDTVPAAQLYTGVWIEQLAASLAAKPAVKDSLDGGTNYAYGSATNAPGTQVVTYGPGNALTVTVNNVGQQIATYLATKPTITANTLFVVWGGANDLLQATTSAQIIAAAQLDLANVQALITAGATNIIILNQSPTTSAPATAAAAAYNAAIAQGIAALVTANKSVHLYPLDTYSLFNTIISAPASLYGLVNTVNSSQTLAVNPDTYLFWDDLHPTTRVHHLIDLAANNLLTQTSTAAVALTLGTANAIPGQAVSLKAVVSATATGTQPVPTGVVTFYAGSTAIVTAALDATGTANASLPAPVVGTYAITAQYTGDPVYATVTSAAQTLNVLATPVATTTTVTSNNLAANLSASVTLTATVSSLVGPPTGSVTFKDGTNTLGMVNLAGTTTSTAALTLTTLTAGTHAITAVYAGTSTFATSTSTAISEVVTAPSYTFTASPSSLTISSGGGISTTLTVTPVGGFSGSFTLACGTLPAHAACSFGSTTLAPTGNNAAVSTTLTINTSLNASAVPGPLDPIFRGSDHLQTYAAVAFLPCLGGLALVGRRRRRIVLPLLLALVAFAATLGISGCSARQPQYTPAGTYQIPVTLSSGGASAATLNVSLTVQ
jgi:phospholipase/lecithinase/hemolysin